jgi:hypothetical protein
MGIYKDLEKTMAFDIAHRYHDTDATRCKVVTAMLLDQQAKG